MYIINQNKAGRYFFTVNNRSGKVLAKSPIYYTEKGVEKAIQSCQIHAYTSNIKKNY